MIRYQQLKGGGPLSSVGYFSGYKIPSATGAVEQPSWRPLVK